MSNRIPKYLQPEARPVPTSEELLERMSAVDTRLLAILEQVRALYEEHDNLVAELLEIQEALAQITSSN